MGLASALALDERGARLVIVGLDEESCKEAESQLSGRAKILQNDATSESTIKTAIAVGLQMSSRIDGLFHVAGGSGRKFGDGALHDMSNEAWQKTFALNLDAIMFSNREIIRYFLENNLPGKILNMGSVLASHPSPHFFVTHAYAAAKSALIGFTKSIASYYAPRNISVNVIAPGLVNTPMAKRAMAKTEIQHFLKSKQPLDGGRAADANDIVSAMLMFFDPKNVFMTGQVLHVDGGWSVSEGQWH